MHSLHCTVVQDVFSCMQWLAHALTCHPICCLRLPSSCSALFLQYRGKNVRWVLSAGLEGAVENLNNSAPPWLHQLTQICICLAVFL